MKITLEKAYTHELSRSVNMTQIKLIIITVQEGSGKKLLFMPRYLCFCLSETIFLDNFMKKIYNFINGTQMLHLFGTYEQVRGQWHI